MSGFRAATPRKSAAEPMSSVRRPSGVSGGGLVPSGLRNIAQSVGTMTSATKSELERVMISVTGR